MNKATLLDKLKSFLDGRNFYYKVFEDGVSIPFAPGGLRTFGDVQMFIYARDNGLSSYCYLPIKAAEKQYANVSELMARLQSRFVYGGFQLNFKGGEIFYWLFSPSSMIERDEKSMLEDAVSIPYNAVVDFCEAFVDVVVRGVSPEEAVKKIV